MGLQIEAFLDSIENFAQRKFLFRSDLSWLIKLSESESLQREFEELIFLAKFTHKASKILKHSGSNGVDVSKVSLEFRRNIERTNKLLRTIIQHAPADIKEIFIERFLSIKHTSLDNLLKLLNELGWIKNYLLDQSYRQ